MTAHSKDCPGQVHEAEIGVQGALPWGEPKIVTERSCSACDWRQIVQRTKAS